MSKSDKLNIQGALASRSRSAQKVLDIERRFIDDLFQECFRAFEATPKIRLEVQDTLSLLTHRLRRPGIRYALKFKTLFHFSHTGFAAAM